MRHGFKKWSDGVWRWEDFYVQYVNLGSSRRDRVRLYRCLPLRQHELVIDIAVSFDTDPDELESLFLPELWTKLKVYIQDQHMQFDILRCLMYRHETDRL